MGVRFDHTLSSSWCDCLINELPNYAHYIHQFEPTFNKYEEEIVPPRVYSQQEIESFHKDQARLHQERKLTLVLDLDHTLVHCTKNKANAGNAPSFTVGDEVWYFHFRPGLTNFLQAIQPLFDVHMYTFATRPYAEHLTSAMIAMCRDRQVGVPFRTLFTRNECLNKKRKSVREMFPCTSTIIAVDDNKGDVWMDCHELLRIPPYYYFGKKSKRSPNDKHLTSLLAFLRQFHSIYFEQGTCDTRFLLGKIRELARRMCPLSVLAVQREQETKKRKDNEKKRRRDEKLKHMQLQHVASQHQVQSFNAIIHCATATAIQNHSSGRFAQTPCDTAVSPSKMSPVNAMGVPLSTATAPMNDSIPSTLPSTNVSSSTNPNLQKPTDSTSAGDGFEETTGIQEKRDYGNGGGSAAIPNAPATIASYENVLAGFNILEQQSMYTQLANQYKGGGQYTQTSHGNSTNNPPGMFGLLAPFTLPTSLLPTSGSNNNIAANLMHCNILNCAPFATPPPVAIDTTPRTDNSEAANNSVVAPSASPTTPTSTMSTGTVTMLGNNQLRLTKSSPSNATAQQPDMVIQSNNPLHTHIPAPASARGSNTINSTNSTTATNMSSNTTFTCCGHMDCISNSSGESTVCMYAHNGLCTTSTLVITGTPSQGTQVATINNGQPLNINNNINNNNNSNGNSARPKRVTCAPPPPPSSNLTIGVQAANQGNGGQTASSSIPHTSSIVAPHTPQKLIILNPPINPHHHQQQQQQTTQVQPTSPTSTQGRNPVSTVRPTTNNAPPGTLNVFDLLNQVENVTNNNTTTTGSGSAPHPTSLPNAIPLKPLRNPSAHHMTLHSMSNVLTHQKSMGNVYCHSNDNKEQAALHRANSAPMTTATSEGGGGTPHGNNTHHHHVTGMGIPISHLTGSGYHQQQHNNNNVPNVTTTTTPTSARGAHPHQRDTHVKVVLGPSANQQHHHHHQQAIVPSDPHSNNIPVAQQPQQHMNLYDTGPNRTPVHSHHLNPHAAHMYGGSVPSNNNNTSSGAPSFMDSHAIPTTPTINVPMSPQQQRVTSVTAPVEHGSNVQSMNGGGGAGRYSQQSHVGPAAHHHTPSLPSSHQSIYSGFANSQSGNGGSHSYSIYGKSSQPLALNAK